MIATRVLAAFALVACGNESQMLVPGDANSDDAPAQLTCGPGTVDQADACVPASRRFVLRIAELELGANGHTKRRIRVYGREPDGSPVLERVVVAVSRASAGTITESDLQLRTHGATTFFTPCLATAADCLGPATVTLALASAPGQVLATEEIALVPETDVSSVAPCIDADTKLYLDGNDFIRTTIYEAEEGLWEPPTQLSNDFSITLTAADPNVGRASVVFDTLQLGVPMTTPGIFADARRAAFTPPGHPGMDIGGGGHECNMLGGSFQIHHYTRDTSTTELDILVSFEQHCEFAPELTEGCLRYKP